MGKYKDSVAKMLKFQFDDWFSDSSVVELDVLLKFIKTMEATCRTIGEVRLADICLISYKKTQKFSNPLTKNQVYEILFDLFRACDLNNELEMQQKEQIHVLMYSNDYPLILYVRDVLKNENVDINITNNEKKLINQLSNKEINCLLIDVSIDQSYDLMKVIKETSDIPMISIANENKIEIEEKSYKCGANLFLTKPFTPQKLIMHVQRLSKNNHMVKQKDRILNPNVHKKFLSKKDASKVFYDLERSSYRPLTMALINLKGLSNINELNGYEEGNKYLEMFATHLTNTFNNQDQYIIRFGGTKFLLFFDNELENRTKTKLEEFLKVIKNEHLEFPIEYSCAVIEASDNRESYFHYIIELEKLIKAAKNNFRTCILTKNNPTIYTKFKILIIDDDQSMRLFLKDLIEEVTTDIPEIKIETFRNGANFISSNWFEHDREHLVLLDGIMPQMDGLEVLKLLRSSTSDEQVKVIMLTGRNSEQDIINAFEAGADEFISKPFSVPEFEARVKRLISKGLKK